MDAPAPLPHALPGTLVAAPARAVAPLVTSEVLELANPPQRSISRVCCSLLSIEMIRALEASTSFRVRRSNDTVAQLAQIDGAIHVPPLLTSEDEVEMVRARVDAIGAHLGAGIAARWVQLLTSSSRHKPVFSDDLDVVKFFCKDVWYTLWNKQIDNLRTNHKVCAFLLTRAYLSCKIRPSVHSARAPRWASTAHYRLHLQQACSVAPSMRWAYGPRHPPTSARRLCVRSMYASHQLSSIVVLMTRYKYTASLSHSRCRSRRHPHRTKTRTQRGHRACCSPQLE